MITRVYANNFKCLVNFELSLESSSPLFLGANGAGKTTIFDLLFKVRELIIENRSVDSLFDDSTLTKWLNEERQQIEIDLQGDDGLYRYRLELERHRSRHLSRITEESLFCNGQPLFRFSIEQQGDQPIGRARLYTDSYTQEEGIPFAMNWSHSGLAMIHERPDNKKLTFFKQQILNWYVLQISPSSMGAVADCEATYPKRDLSNYASWLRYLVQENRRAVSLFEEILKEIIEDFELFHFAPAGDSKLLYVEFSNQLKYRLNELSDGQKTLIALYTLLYSLPEGSLLAIDEPENFLALPEIQPWLDRVHDLAEEKSLQVILISHHPRIINWLSLESGYWFSREKNRHIRVQRISANEAESGLPIAMLVERGWIDDQV